MLSQHIENNLIEIINILKHCSLKLLELDKKHSNALNS